MDNNFLSVCIETIPPELKKYPYWCYWRAEERQGQITKPPLSPHGGKHAKSNDKSTFASFSDAFNTYKGTSSNGIGIGLFDGWAAVDIDHCIDDTGTISDMATDIINMMQSYTEFSPSRKGIRIIFRVSDDFTIDKDKYYIHKKDISLEIYIAGVTKKYVTITGNKVNECSVEVRDTEIKTVLDKYMKRQGNQRKEQLDASFPVDLSDDEVIRRACSAKNGEEFSRLLSGDISKYDNDDSRADMSFCNMLAFWCRCDTDQMDRIFRGSGLMRDKWDRQQSGSTYGKITIEKAVKECKKVYEPQKKYTVTIGSDKPIPSLLAANQPLTVAATQELLRWAGITVKLNLLSNKIEISDLPDGDSKENALEALPALLYDCAKYTLSMKGVNLARIRIAIGIVADRNRYNPLADYLKAVIWDKKDRLQSIYQILGIKDTPRYQTYTRKWLMQCVAMGLNNSFEPEGAEGVLVLQGAQGCGKTSFFRSICPQKGWFVEGASLDMNNKDSLINALRGWICELGELDSTFKREQTQLKAFITQYYDSIRMPYAVSAADRPRRTSFCATVNNPDFLRDETGSRRWWVIPVENIDKRQLFALDAAFIHQLWAQVYEMYQQNPAGFRLSDEEMTTLQQANSAFNVALQYQLEIMELLDFSIPFEDWEWWSAAEIKDILHMNSDARKIGKALTAIILGQEIKELIPKSMPQENLKQKISVYKYR